MLPILVPAVPPSFNTHSLCPACEKAVSATGYPITHQGKQSSQRESCLSQLNEKVDGNGREGVAALGVLAQVDQHRLQACVCVCVRVRA